MFDWAAVGVHAVTIPKLFGPDLFPNVLKQVCFLQQEGGIGLFLLENGQGFVQLESCKNAPPTTFLIELETGLARSNLRMAREVWSWR